MVATSIRALLLLCALLGSADVLASARYYRVAGLSEAAPDPALRAQSAALQEMFDELAERAGVDATLLYSDSPDINAFATEVEGTQIVVLNHGLLELLEDDRDAVAAVIGHELAHHKADHVRAGHRKQQGGKVLGVLLGAVVGAKLGRRHGELAGALGGAAVGVGASLVALKFNRRQELEADRLSVEWLADSDFHPEGMLRLQSTLGELSEGDRASIFDTHPRSEKRRKAAQQQIAALGIAQPTSPGAPLVDARALARAESAVSAQREAQLAKALRPDALGQPQAAALAPVEGVDFDRFAEIANRLVRAGEANEAALLGRYQLDGASYARVRDTYLARMSQDAALAARYSPVYLRASEGPLAAHGRDVAASMAEGKALALDPPYPLESAVVMLRAVTESGALGMQGAERQAFETSALAPHGLDFYDFLIGHAWWMRKARIDAALGDSQTMQALAAAQRPARDDQAARAGVHFGDKVRIGKGVRVGGQPVEHD